MQASEQCSFLVSASVLALSSCLGSCGTLNENGPIGFSILNF